MGSRRIFALIPAAGVSQRMGKPKLLLPWNGLTIIENLINSLREAGITDIIIVIRPDDEELAKHLKDLSLVPVIPEIPTSDMKASVQKGLEFIRDSHVPGNDDFWLLCPADYPLVSSETVQALLEHGSKSIADIITPLYQTKRGHPILLNWKLTEEVFQLPENSGINSILRDQKYSSIEVPVDDPGILQDIDTPEDYEKYRS